MFPNHILSRALPSYRLRNMQGMRETQLTANIELLPITETTRQKQSSKPPISMNFEVSYLLTCI